MSNLDIHVLGNQKFKVKVISDRIALKKGLIIDVEKIDSHIDEDTIGYVKQHKNSVMDKNGDICVFVPELSDNYMWILKRDYAIL